ncbi:hypothetical protein G8J22_01300 [Lentilactobacillus hilgardii]|uniref:recombinase RecT n=1 Tax=Lentilactobacillus hilgardii TaxID=1588 RepID=UPI00019C6231|nr:RecT family recombinase [Lentilactobacillus hilgardii]EEI18909.1 RecT family protein [Lentilactobacillus buchneri ATCC 11577]QIR09321.1 hypothetical protein G8J22_01300 [Lentilactobacillus hilgardii]
MANELAILQKDLTDQINTKLDGLRKGGLATPKNYNPANALKSAFFALTNANGGNLLEKGSKDSIANALVDMVVQGLTPAKDQVYFIPYGKQVTLQRSYFGTQAALKRLNSVQDIWAEVVHKDDEFEISAEDGRLIVSKFKPSFENLDKPIVGTFAVVQKVDGEKIYTVMTKKQIDTSWSQARNHNVQQKFPEEMAKRTVINRAAKNFLNTSDDSDLLVDSINRTTSNEYDNRKDVTPDKLEKKKVTDFIEPAEPKASDQKVATESANSVKQKSANKSDTDDTIDVKDDDGDVTDFLNKFDKGESNDDRKDEATDQGKQGNLFGNLNDENVKQQ